MKRATISDVFSEQERSDILRGLQDKLEGDRDILKKVEEETGPESPQYAFLRDAFQEMMRRYGELIDRFESEDE